MGGRFAADREATVVTEGSPAPTLRDVGEDAVIAAVTAVYPPPPPWLELGPGDDAAVLAPLAGRLVVSTDALVEGEDFLPEWSGGHDVGVKLAAQNLADVAAMGARPLGLVVTLAAPADREVGWAVAVSHGLAEECARAGAAVIGGDLSAGPVAMLTATALGVLDGPAVRRDGARPGDVVAVAGRLGPAAAGLQLLFDARDGRRAPGLDEAAVREAVTAQVRPRPPYAAGAAAAAAGATAMIDTSDGLLRDAARSARASGVTLDLSREGLAADVAGLRPVARDDAQAWEWVLSGGEDHAMLACFPPGSALPPGFRGIGRVVPQGGSAVVLDGETWRGTQGWVHWS
ncbi:MAG: thiamine-phosphate kinase [Kineosporiaceae bacterium]